MKTVCAKRWASLFLLVLITSSASWAQQVFGSIYGTVTDKSGAAVANAKITITDVNKATKSEIASNDSGNYTKGQLIPGTYQVESKLPDFPRRSQARYSSQSISRPGSMWR